MDNAAPTVYLWSGGLSASGRVGSEGTASIAEASVPLKLCTRSGT